MRRVPWAALSAAGLVLSLPVEARVTRIVVDTTTAIAGQPYEELTGRAFGELDPNHPNNALITDLLLAPRNARGNVEYIASWRIRKPTDPSTSSGVLWHDVPNRGGNVGFNPDLFAAGDIHLLSGWQGDNAGNTRVPANVDCLPPYVAPCAAPAFSNHYVKTPVLAGVTGKILGRIVNRSGLQGQPLNVMGNPIPYWPVDLANNAAATLTTVLHETIDGKVTYGPVVPNGDWKFCAPASTFAAPVTPTTLPVGVCLKDGFDPAKLYQLVYTVKDPYVLGAGTAAFRDVVSFFRYEARDDAGTPNPLAGHVKRTIARGSSQSGNFLRHFIHLGMTQDEAGRKVHDGSWPLIAGRRVANNSRWGQPDGVLELYQMGSEGPQWWHRFPDHARRLHPAGILDRCEASKTCPKVVETFGSAEVYSLKMTTSWVGTTPHNDIPLPKNVRRYYLPSSTHGGNNGRADFGFNEAIPAAGVNCPGNNWGRGTLRANTVPANVGLVNRVRTALREWVLNDTAPPPSRWPLKRDKNLVEPTMKAMGFPKGVPGIPESIFKPENFVFPVFDYDWGPEYDHSDANGVPTNSPPPIRRVIEMLVPRVDRDGNEIGGVPTVLNDAPLGTYLGWNVTAGAGDAEFDGRPFHAGQVCNYVGGMVPFAKTKAERKANKDPRLSLEERYGTHDGYVAAVKKAANDAACQGYLHAGPEAAKLGAKCTRALPPGVTDDWVLLVTAAMDSNVCNQPGDNGKCNPVAP
jgi:hypothetical protein